MSKEWKTEPWVLTKGMRDPALIVGVIAHVTQVPWPSNSVLSICRLFGLESLWDTASSHPCDTGTELSWLQLWLSCLRDTSCTLGSDGAALTSCPRVCPTS